MEVVLNVLGQILPLALSALFYAVVIGVGIFVIMVIRKYNLQDEVAGLVAAAEMVYPGLRRGKDKKQWVVDEMQKKFPSIHLDYLDKLIERFVYEITK